MYWKQIGISGTLEDRKMPFLVKWVPAEANEGDDKNDAVGAWQDQEKFDWTSYSFQSISSQFSQSRVHHICPKIYEQACFSATWSLLSH